MHALPRHPRAARRAGALATAVATIAGVFALLPQPAFAAGTVNSASPAQTPNNGTSPTITFSTSDAYTLPGPHVILTRKITVNGTPTVVDSYDVTASSTSSNPNTVTATFNFQSNGAPAAPGPYDAEICYEAPTSCSTAPGSPDDLGSNVVVLVGKVPVVSSVSNSVRATDAPTAFSIQGSNFAIGDTVTFVRTSGSGTHAPGLTVTKITASQITGTLTDLGTADPATYDAIVTDTSGQQSLASSADQLTIVPEPIITSVSPTTVGQGAGQNGSAPRQITIVASPFAAADTATVTFPAASGLTATVSSVSQDAKDTSAADIVAAVTATSTATTPASLTLTDTTSGGTATSTALTVTQRPTLGTTGQAIGQNASKVSMKFTGGGLVKGATAADTTKLVFPAASKITQTGDAVVDPQASPQTITVVLSVGSDAPTGKVPFSIVNPDGGRTDYTTTTSPLTVDKAPTLTSMSPPSVVRGTTNQVVTVVGTNFASGMTATAVDSSGTPRTDVTFGKVTLPSGSTTQGTIPVSATSTATRGPVLVQLQNVDGGTSSAVQALTIDSFGVSSISPTSATNATNSTANKLTIAGTNIPSGSTQLKLTPTFSVVGQSPILVPASSVTSTQWVGTANLVGMAAGVYQVQLVNGDDTGTCSCTFRIVSAGVPAVTKVTPSALGQGAATTLTLTGTNFARGATVSFTAGQITATGPTTYDSPTQLEVPVQVSPTASTGAGKVVTVTNTGPTPNSGACSCLTVDAGPVVKSFSPKTLGQGAATKLTITGTGFDPKATLTFGTGIAKNGTPTITTTQITVPVKVASNAPSSVTVTVQNPDFGKGSAALPIAAGPTVTAVAPHSVPSTFDGTLTVTGTGFATGATVSFPTGSGVSVPAGKSATMTGNGTTLTVPVVVSRTTAAAVDVTVTNATTDFGSTTCTGCLEVVVPATKSALSIHHSAHRVVNGHRLTLHGALTDAAGAPIGRTVVSIYRQNDRGRIRLLTTTATDGSGDWAVTFHPHHNATYAATYRGNASHLATKSGTVRTVVAPRITLHTTTSGSAATPLVVTGAVSPNKRGHRVHLVAIDSNGHRHALGARTLTRHSTYRFSVSLGRGTWHLQVRIGKTSGNVAGHSTKRRVTRS